MYKGDFLCALVTIGDKSQSYCLYNLGHLPKICICSVGHNVSFSRNSIFVY